MDEHEPDTHPLDRDYSIPVPTQRRNETSFHPKLRRIGFIWFAAGFITVVLAAIVLSNARTGDSIDSIGRFIHQAAMVMILIGGVLIVGAYRLPILKETMKSRDRKSKRKRMPSFLALIGGNLIAFFVIVLSMAFLRSIVSRTVYFLVFNATLTISCAFMVTLAIWHRGMIRGYAIGISVALLLNSYLTLFMLNSGFWGRDESFMFFGILTTILCSGLVSAALALWLEPDRPESEDKIENKRQQSPRDER